MPRGKIDLQKVLSSLNTPCPKCGHQITPAEIKRVTWNEIECPLCGERFDASKTKRTAMEKLGLVGEKGNAQVVFVVAVSCILERPLNLFVKGPSSTGKNWLVTRVLSLLPKSAVREITSAPEQAWRYTRSDFRHRVVYLQERNDAVGRTDPMRLLISEGRLVRVVTHFEGGRRVARKFVARGPVAAISTTTKPRLQTDDETRHISIWMDESKEQNREVARA